MTDFVLTPDDLKKVCIDNKIDNNGTAFSDAHYKLLSRVFSTIVPILNLGGVAQPASSSVDTSKEVEILKNELKIANEHIKGAHENSSALSIKLEKAASTEKTLRDELAISITHQNARVKDISELQSQVMAQGAHIRELNDKLSTSASGSVPGMVTKLSYPDNLKDKSVEVEFADGSLCGTVTKMEEDSLYVSVPSLNLVIPIKASAVTSLVVAQ